MSRPHPTSKTAALLVLLDRLHREQVVDLDAWMLWAGIDERTWRRYQETLRGAGVAFVCPRRAKSGMKIVRLVEVT